MKKKPRRKNPHAVALGRLGGLVRNHCGAAQCATATPWAPQEVVNAVISTIRARYGALAIGRGANGIRYHASH
jgi:hypothetical protein